MRVVAVRPSSLGLLACVAIVACSTPQVDGSPRDGSSIDGGVLPDGGSPLRVLFVGNSYTSVNDLPSVVRALADATAGPSIEVESVLVGGATLADHWSSTGARERITTGGFDSVVLQGQSLEPVFTPDDFDAHASLFAGALRDAGARGVWFATWARRDVESDPLVLTEALEVRYRTAAAHNGDTVARVGAAWQIALLELPDVLLHAADGSHPTAAGTLLASCVIYQALTGRTPRVPDPPPLGVPADVASALCAIADRGVPCDAGESFCAGACVGWDTDNCGGCGVECLEGDPCRRGVCGCDPGLTGCSERCTNVLIDPANCGSCGTSCPAGAVCDSGACACPSTGRYDILTTDLSVFTPACDATDDYGSADCNLAAHRFCESAGSSLDCFTSGFGPPSGHAPGANAVMCVHGEVRTTSYAALQALVPACDGVVERSGPNCLTAIHRHCRATGAEAGFGPVAIDADSVTITCLPSAGATVVHTTFEDLYAFASRCTADPVTCSLASWNFCASLGHVSGFGPVEVSADGVDVVCVDS